MKKTKSILLIAVLLLLAVTMPAQEIFDAVKSNDLAKVKVLVEKDASAVNLKNSVNNTPLHCAIKSNHFDIAKYLIENGADINAKTKQGQSFLNYAVNYGAAEIVELLIEKGSDVKSDKDSRGFGLLFTAVAKDYTEIAEILIKNGAEVNPKNPYGITPVFYARTFELAKLLLDNEAELNIQEKLQGGRTPLQLAIENNAEKIVELYLSHGADPTIKDTFNKSALGTAVDNGNMRILRLILEKINKLPDDDKQSDQSLLHRASINGSAEIIRLLIDNGLNCNIQDKAGNTPLFYAYKYGHRKVAAILEENGATSDNTVNNFGFSPLLNKNLKYNEAVVWYLGHSGWAVKTQNRLLLFDYFEYGTNPDEPLLANGHINTEEIKNMNTYVFVSHEHRDHFDRKILDWENRIMNIRYVFGWNVMESDKYTCLKGTRTSAEIDDIIIYKISSNVEPGGAFLVDVDGITIYFGGDYSGEIKQDSDLQYLSKAGPGVDIVFLSPGKKNWAHYTIETLKPKVVFPMHARNYEQVLKLFPGGSGDKFSQVNFLYPENRGDVFFYPVKEN